MDLSSVIEVRYAYRGIRDTVARFLGILLVKLIDVQIDSIDVYGCCCSRSIV